MARILQIHNEYLLHGGEDVVVASEYELLLKNGHDVRQFIVRNRDADTSTGWGKTQVSLTAIWSRQFKKELGDILATFKPEIVHVHNFFPLLSPSLFRYLKSFGCRVVLTLHNYRLLCAGATLLRDGHICTLCLDGSRLNAVRYGCYKGSVVGSAVNAASMSLHFAIHSFDQVDQFIVLSDFASAIFASNGIPAAKHLIKQNFVPHAPQEYLALPRKNSMVFAGRLSPEKGVDRLLAAWEKLGVRDWELNIVGDGPLRESLVSNFGHVKSVNWLGQLTHEEVLRTCAEARWLVIPSRCYEQTPMIGLEAMSVGTPIIVPNLGSLPSLISPEGSGLIFEDEPELALQQTLEQAIRTSPDDWRRFSALAGEKTCDTFSPENGYRLLMKAYGLVELPALDSAKVKAQ